MAVLAAAVDEVEVVEEAVVRRTGHRPHRGKLLDLSIGPRNARRPQWAARRNVRKRDVGRRSVHKCKIVRPAIDHMEIWRTDRTWERIGPVGAWVELARDQIVLVVVESAGIVPVAGIGPESVTVRESATTVRASEIDRDLEAIDLESETVRGSTIDRESPTVPTSAAPVKVAVGRSGRAPEMAADCVRIGAREPAIDRASITVPALTIGPALATDRESEIDRASAIAPVWVIGPESSIGPILATDSTTLMSVIAGATTI
jgi:hypothetical protein